jgi:hypothetical protein
MRLETIQTVFDWLHQKRVFWWPFGHPPDETPIGWLRYLKTAVFYAALPIVLSIFALMGAVYVPTVYLTDGGVVSVLGGLTVCVGWVLLCLGLLAPSVFFWNRRARRLSGEAAQPFVHFGIQGLPAPKMQYNAWNRFAAPPTVRCPVVPLMTLLVVSAGLVTLLILGTLPLGFTLISADLARMSPTLTMQPEWLELGIETHAPSDPLRTVCCLGYEQDGRFAAADFSGSNHKEFIVGVPWPAIQLGELKDFVSVCTPEGKCLFFRRQKTAQAPLVQVKSLQSHRKTASVRYRSLVNASFQEADDLEALLSVAPQSITPLSSPWEAKAQFDRLFQKLVLVGGRRHLYQFNTGQFSGFQVGHPALDSWVHLILFDRNHGGFTLDVGTRPDATQRLTQLEINAILESLQEIQPRPSVARVGPRDLPAAPSGR